MKRLLNLLGALRHFIIENASFHAFLLWVMLRPHELTRASASLLAGRIKSDRGEILVVEVERRVLKEARSGLYWASLHDYNDEEFDAVAALMGGRGFSFDRIEGLKRVRWDD